MIRSSLTRPPLRRRFDVWYRRIVLRSFAYETVWWVNTTDDTLSAIEERVMALEEIIAARWWQRGALRRRLAAELRASARQGAHAGKGFRTRRAEAVAEEMDELDRRRRERREGTR